MYVESFTEKMFKCIILLVLCSCANCYIGQLFSPRDCYILEPSGGYECLALMTRYRYNPYLGYCEQYTYGGCNENRNSFETYQECAYVTYPVCKANSYPPPVPGPSPWDITPPPGMPGLYPPYPGGHLTPPPWNNLLPNQPSPWHLTPPPSGMPGVYPPSPSWHLTPPPISGWVPLRKK